MILDPIFFFVKFHKILSFGYQKIDFGCLKWSRMIPGTKYKFDFFKIFSIKIHILVLNDYFDPI